MINAFAKVRIFLMTLRYLKAKQVIYYIWRRGIGARAVTVDSYGCMRAEFSYVLPMQDPIDANAIQPCSEPKAYQFCFLNVEKQFDPGQMDWAPNDMQRLWCYHLHYFDYLQDSDRTNLEKAALIDRWIKDNPQGRQPAWEPYTTSLRIVNWCRYFGPIRSSLATEWQQSLYEQCLWLEKNIEYHILANHLFENIKALLFAGAYFGGRNGDRWLKQGESLLIQELNEQFLSDGAHYERCPSYHARVLEGLLDLIALSAGHGSVCSQALQRLLRMKAEQALVFYQRICLPNGELPLFNDSTLSTATSLSELEQRAHGLGLDLGQPERNRHSTELISSDEAGLYGFRSGQDMFIMDCGDIGPDYQPGHSHCDFLSYELMIGGERLIVDTGVCEYEPGPLRSYVRSTRAHNTIQVDGFEQSEIWGAFRMARRARKLDADVRHADRDMIELEGAFDGFPGRPMGRVTHRRTVRAKLNESGGIGQVQIRDTISGRGQSQVENYIHLHPSICVVEEVPGVFHLSRNHKQVARICAAGGLITRLEKTWYCPEFGLKIENITIVLTQEGPLPIQLFYEVEVY